MSSAVRTPSRAPSRPRARRQHRSALSALPVLLAVFLAGFALGRHSLSSPRPSADNGAPLPDWVQVDLLPVNEYSRPGLALTQVNGVVVHYVGNPGTTAAQNRSYFASLAETHETHASAHFVIGLEGEVIQCVPLEEMAYCSNDRNSDTVSIECCHPGEDGAFTSQTYDALVQLTRYLTARYGLEREQVIRHYDVTGKRCPLYFVEHEDAWEAFRDAVS